MEFDPLDPPRPARPPGRLRRALPPRRTLLIWAWPVLGALVIGVLGGVGVAAAINIPRVEAITEYTPTLITEFHDREGKLFATYARERRVMLDEGEIPEVLQQAVIAAEDGGFLRHGGIDAFGVVRAVFANLEKGRRFSGASTITMQLARMLYLSPEKRWRRKIEESFLAVELEKNLTKQQILTLYCNLVNLGHGRYGVEAASRYFFNKPAADLELVEAATLAGIIQRPSDYSPYRRPEAVVERRDYVLRRMREEGYISRERYELARQEPLLVVRQRPRDQLAPYFAEEVRQQLEAEYGATRLYEGGLRVATTLDSAVQSAAERALREGLLRLDHRRGFRGELLELEGGDLERRALPAWDDLEPVPGRWYQGIVLDTNRNRARVKIHDRIYDLGPEGISWTRRSSPSDLLRRGDVAWFRLAAPEGGGEPVLHLEQEPQVEGAVVVLESASGAIRGLVGGWDFERSKFNRAIQAERQVGSAYKLFVYGAALEAGFTPADTIFDGPTAFRGAEGPTSYRPQNHGRRYYGILTLRRALEASINIPAVKLLDMVGVDRVIDFTKRCGIDARLPPYPSLALGSADIRPIELAAAFAAIANQGTWVKPYLVDRVTTAAGRTLEQHFPETRTATTPQVAYVLTHMLEGAIDRGTAQRLRDLPVAIAGKTGTTDEYSDAWFIGSTPRHTLLVWVGYDLKRSLGRGMDGSSTAVPIWKDLALAGLEAGWIEAGAAFSPPSGVTFAGVDFRSGLLSEGGFRESFVAGTEPAQPYGPKWGLILSLPWYQQQAFYIPKRGERMPFAARSEADAEETETGDEGTGP
ncbi:MAG TPA: PBP1A family penicillin-binding protein [Thermoanaerobaculia bacterium]|nr:PBP1A family penicillin-binding protein [Thermoanaerobaculia bacterium]